MKEYWAGKTCSYISHFSALYLFSSSIPSCTLESPRELFFLTMLMPGPSPETESAGLGWGLVILI